VQDVTVRYSFLEKVTCLSLFVSYKLLSFISTNIYQFENMKIDMNTENEKYIKRRAGKRIEERIGNLNTKRERKREKL